MERNFLLNCFLFLLIACHNKTPPGSSSLFSLKLQAADNSIFDFSLLKNNKASVFIFLAPDCPLSQNYTLTLNNLFEMHVSDSIIFYGVIPGNNIETEEVRNYSGKYKIGFKLLLDTGQVLTRYFNAEKTPEVFVVDTQGALLYHGAIDNWASDLGQHRSVISEHYLPDALSSIAGNTPIKIKETKATGCFIERNKPD